MALFRCGSGNNNLKIEIKGYSRALGYEKSTGSVRDNMKSKSFTLVYQINSDGTVTLISGSASGTNQGIDMYTNQFGVYGSGYSIQSVSVVE